MNPEMDAAIWEAARRQAEQAPVIEPGSEVALTLQALLPDLPERARERAAVRRESAA